MTIEEATTIAVKNNMKLSKHAKVIIKGVNKKDGHCPCELFQTEDNICPCITFRIKKECRCGLFEVKE